MSCEVVQEQIADVVETLARRTDELAILLSEAITQEVRPYQVPFDVVAQGCAANMRPVLSAIAAQGELDPRAAAQLGAERARDGVPLSSVMDAYRVGFRRLWEALAEELATRAHTNGDALCTLTAKLLTAQDIFTGAMAVGYREEQTRRLLADGSKRSDLVDSLLSGRLCGQWSLWEVADCLRLPSRGPFVVIAADLPVVGVEALPNIESKLRSLDVFSAWRLLPDVQVGIVHFKTDKNLADVLAPVSRMTTTRVGVSARFDDLRETSQALGYARVMLRGRPDPGPLVSVFDGSILAGAAVSAPEAMTKLVAPTLDRFAELASEEREILLDTFSVWVENDGSLRDTGKSLFCHPNTVRYRLHRIEQHRPLSVSTAGYR